MRRFWRKWCEGFGHRWQMNLPYRICERCEREQEIIFVKIPETVYHDDGGLVTITTAKVCRYIWVDL